MDKFDLLVVGAGLSGCVIAERAAKILNWKVLIIDKRNHIGGNCFDEYSNSGILTHKYGPHYFRTNNEDIVSYLSQFTEWIDGDYIVKSFYNNKLYPFPINIDTIEEFYNIKLNEKSAFEFIESKRLKIISPRNSEELVLSRVGRELYEAFYLNYTIKQWDMHPKDLDPSVCGRIPIRYSRSNSYVDHRYKLMPKLGYTKMIENMIKHPNISIRLNTDFKEIPYNYSDKIIYTGPIDEYFNFALGKLPWRSLRFEFIEYNRQYIQDCVQINYPNDNAFTRTVESKHVTKQIHDRTIISFEYPSSQGEPYYPIPSAENKNHYIKYRNLAENEKINKSIFFIGRLAEYSYINMDEAIENSLREFEKIKELNS